MARYGLGLTLTGRPRTWSSDVVRPVRLLGSYVDVNTKRNPRGELRGQIDFG